jgi:PAS domain S-box-containing protein
MNKRIQILLLFLLFFVIEKSQAQTAKVDSLENVLKIHNEQDTVRVNLLNETAFFIYMDDSIKASRYVIEAAELADKLNFEKGLAQSYYITGISLSYNKSDKLALAYFLKALEIAEGINNKNKIATYLIASGISYAAIGNISEATTCYLRANKIAGELKDQDLNRRSIANLSVIYTGKGDYAKALEGYREILRSLEKKDDKKMRSKIFINIGEINRYQGNYPQALEFYHKALKLKEEDNEEPGISLSFINIGSIYALQGDYDKALDYEHRALKIAEKISDKRLISNCYEEIGNAYLQTNKPEALDYFRKALTIVEKLSYQTPILRIVSKIGDFYRVRGDYKEALVNYSRALKISEELRRKRTICETCIKIGGIYFLQKEYAEALKYNQESLALANELKLLDNKKDVHKQLSEIYAATNDYKNAYIHHKQYTEINDSVYNEKNVKKIAELEYTYKFEKEKQAIELEQQKKDAVRTAEKRLQWIIIFSLTTAFILMCLLAIFLYHSYWFKHKTNITLTKQKHEIEAVNDEYLAINEELKASNNELIITKRLVEESEEKLKLLIKNSNDILVLVNEKGEQVFISDAVKNLTGYNVEELFGTIENVIYPDDLDIVRQHWNKVIANKDIADSIQYRHKHKEKGYVWFEAVAQNFLDHPSIKSVVANIRDITERKKVEHALKESEAEKARLMEMEIELIGRELESNKKAVTAATLKLIQNTERDTKTIERLMDIEENTNPAGKQKINTLISDYKRISYNSNWDEFEILFEKVHSSFYEKLNTQFPTLTANERKICAFSKLNMSSKEIAQITFQSDEALKKARLRLRQKLEISRETNLVTFLQNI